MSNCFHSSQEIQETLGDNFDESQSPDIGPPPIAHFDEFESNSPIFEERFKLSDAFDHEICDSSELPPNLETRKKKKDVLSMSDEDWEADERLQPDLPKAGSKRKLCVREDDERNPQKFDESDDFQYNLPAEKPRDDMRKVKLDQASQTTAAKPKNNALKGADITVRKPLGTSKRHHIAIHFLIQKSNPCTENTNTTSPKKQKQSESLEKEVDPKKTAPKPSKPREQKASRKRDKADPTAKTKPRQREVQEEIPLVMPEETCPETVDVQLPPKTPAMDDILSPNPAEPSESKQKSKDTPPPSELTSLTPGTSGLSAETRPSRRPRAAVSYAEPSLRGKMRRSTKELTDAVGEDRFRRSSQIERGDSEEPRSGEEKTKIRTVTVKKEDPDNASWKTLPTTEKEANANEKDSDSPLGNKSGTPSTELPSSVMTKRKRLTMSPNAFDAPEGPSSSSIAISTLVAGSKRPQHGKRLREDVDAEKCAATDSANDGPSSYDGLGTSNDPSNTTDEGHVGSRTVRQSRRNSSKPKDMFQENSAPRKHTFTDDDVDIRREEDDNFTYSKLEDKETARAKAGSGVSKERRKAGRPKRDSSVDTSDPRQAEEQTTHGQRSASRRRSMMV